MPRQGQRLAHGGGARDTPVWPLTLVIDRIPSVAQVARLPGMSVSCDPRTGVVRARFSWPADTLIGALRGAVRALERAGVQALRVDASDWVTCQDIADRAGYSRETVRLWALGRLGPGGFPPPLNPGRQTSFYSWAEVSPWLRTSLGLDVPDAQTVLAAANLILQLRTLAPRLSDPAALWQLARTTSR